MISDNGSIMFGMSTDANPAVHMLVVNPLAGWTGQEAVNHRAVVIFG